MRDVIYFAFGSNLDAGQMRRRCPSSRPIGPAVLRGHRLAFAGYSHGWGGAVATVRRARGRTVRGYLWRVPPEDLAALDRAEGHPRVYRRTWRYVETPVDAIRGRVRAVTYVLPDEVSEGLPADRYYKQIWTACERLGIKTTHIPLPVS